MGKAKPGAGQGGGNSAVAVRVLKILPTQTVHVWALSGVIGGLFQHFGQAGSALCVGKWCGDPCRKANRQWRGYTDVAVWDPDPARWVPMVLEFTPHCELDVRGLWERGQVWAVSRGDRVRKRRGALSASLIETRPAKGTPPPFDIVPALQHVYGPHDLDLSHANPLPARTLIEPTTAPPPLVVQEEAARTLSHEEIRARFAAAGLSSFTPRSVQPEPSSNGKHPPE